MHSHFIVILLSTGLVAGFIDAIVGGGGLLTIPALLACGLAPHTALGSNKLAASFGVMSSTLVYLRKKIYDIKLWLFVVFASVIGAIFGTITIHFISADWLSKVVPFLLIAIIIYMAIPKNLAHPGQSYHYRPPNKVGGTLGLLIGFYDGFLGPGTGSFWTTTLLYFFKLDLLQATAIAKLMNFSSNIVATIVFACYGSINYPAALILLVGYVVGSYVGAHSAIKHGRRLIKPLFLFVVTIIAIKLILK